MHLPLLHQEHRGNRSHSMTGQGCDGSEDAAAASVVKPSPSLPPIKPSPSVHDGHAPNWPAFGPRPSSSGGMERPSAAGSARSLRRAQGIPRQRASVVTATSLADRVSGQRTGSVPAGAGSNPGRSGSVAQPSCLPGSCLLSSLDCPGAGTALTATHPH